MRLDHKATADDPIAQVRRFIADHLAVAEKNGQLKPVRPPNPNEDLWDYFHDRECDWFDSHGEPVNAVLIFDPFEEIFARESRSHVVEERSQRFFDSLSCLAENRQPDGFRRAVEKDPELLRKYRRPPGRLPSRPEPSRRLPAAIGVAQAAHALCDG